MLRRFHVGRFAHIHSPEKERRLLHASIPPPTDDTAGEGVEKNNRLTSNIFEDETKPNFLTEQRRLNMLAFPATFLELEGFEGVCKTPYLLEAILERRETNQRQMRAIFERVLRPQRKDLSVEQLTAKERSFVLQEVLRECPDATLYAIKMIDAHIQDEASATSLERKSSGILDKEFLLSDEHKEILRHRDLFPETDDVVQKLAKLARAFEPIPKERLAALMEKLKTFSHGELGSFEIGIALGFLTRERPENMKSLSEDQHAVIHYLLGYKNETHREWRKNLVREKKASFLKEYDLTKQKEALTQYLELQIEQGASDVRSRRNVIVQEIVKDIKKKDEVLTDEEANRCLLEQNGYGLIGMADAVDAYVHPLHELLSEEQPDRSFKKIDRSDAHFLDHAEKALNILANRKENGVADLPKLLAAQAVAQKETDEWAYNTALALRDLNGLPDSPRKRAVEFYMQRKHGGLTNMHDFFEPNAYLHGYNPGEYERQLEEHPGSRILSTDAYYTAEKRQGITIELEVLKRGPYSMLRGLQQYDALKEKRDAYAQLEDAVILQKIQDVRSKLDEVFAVINTKGNLEHQVCDTLGVQQMLAYRKGKIQTMTTIPFDTKKKQPVVTKELREALPEAELEVSYLEEVQTRFASIHVKDAELAPGDRGSFDDLSGAITINAKRTDHEQTLYHERGHAILWALSPAFPMLLAEQLKKLNDQTSSDRRETFSERLKDLAETTAYEHLSDPQHMDRWRLEAEERLTKTFGGEPSPADIAEETQRIYMEEMLNELLIRHAEWTHESERKIEKNPSPERQKELLLFEQLDKKQSVPSLASESLKSFEDIPGLEEPEGKLKEKGTALRMSRVDEEEERRQRDESTGANQTTDTAPKKMNIHDELREIRRKIEVMESFVKAYPEANEKLREHIERSQKCYSELSDDFLEGQQNGTPPEESDDFLKKIMALRKYTTNIVEEIQKFDVKHLDISQVSKVKQPGFFEHIHFMSVLDIIKLGKDIGEDIQNIYTRRQDRLLKDVGASVTDALGFGKKIPYIGQYFDEIRGYHDRRYSNVDVEAAKKWEESLKFVDSFTVAKMLGTSTNRDFVRGSISLLVSRGDMDWNDESIWHTLEYLSGYKMPTEACKRDDILRDTWLRKMINEAWHDKEQYFSWRQGNDSAIKKNKSDFNPTADQLSNVRGGMATELRKQLELFYNWKHGGEQKGDLIPDDVKPHLYEETLHYAMRNGKMRMEDKFFYLVQGVRHGILSIERLRFLAGEGGEILLKFPFIDYFYQKNNSFSEVQRLGERLEEHEDMFKAGPKTTCFLQYELPQSESYQQRLSKALERDNVEKIDHEDFPQIVGQVNYKMISDMLGHLSGDRFKMTKEAVKNSYTGFTTKFKSMARLVDMEDAGKARFTKSDARSMAMSVATYIHFDNLVTGKARDNSKRQSLSWNDIEYTSGPSNGGMTVSVFRDSAYGFVHELLHKLENEGIFRWEHIKEQLEDTGQHFSKENFLQNIGNKFVSKSKPNEQQEAAFDAIEYFQTELEAALLARPDILKTVLRQQADTHTPNYLMEEHASEGEEFLTKEKVLEYLQERSQEERKAVT